MATPTFEKLMTSLRLGNYAACYFLEGASTFQIDQAANYIKSKVLPKALQPLNLQIWQGDEVTMAQVIEAARALPIQGNRKVILIKRAEVMRDLQKKEGQKLLIHYLEHPNPHALLLFTYAKKRLDRRSSLAKTLAQKAILLTTRKPYTREIGAWIEDYVSSSKGSITLQAKVALQARLGEELAMLSNALDRLLLCCEAGEKITATLVEREIVMEKSFTSFALQRAIAAQDCMEALRIADHFAQHPKTYPFPPVLALLSQFFCTLLIQKSGEEAIKNAPPTPPYLLADLRIASRHYEKKKIIQALYDLAQADRQYKGIETSPLQEGVLYPILVAKLVAKKSTQ